MALAGILTHIHHFEHNWCPDYKAPVSLQRFYALLNLYMHFYILLILFGDLKKISCDTLKVLHGHWENSCMIEFFQNHITCMCKDMSQGTYPNVAIIGVKCHTIKLYRIALVKVSRDKVPATFIAYSIKKVLHILYFWFFF